MLFRGKMLTLQQLFTNKRKNNEENINNIGNNYGNNQ